MSRNNRRRGRNGDPSTQLRRLLVGDDPLPPGTWVITSELWTPLVTYLGVGRTFRRRGLSAALSRIPAVSGRHPARALINEATAFSARAASWRLVGAARTVAGAHLCLHEALGTCAALRELGFPVQVVIGYPLIESNRQEQLHAWPALGPFPLAGDTDTNRVNFEELFRYPHLAADCRGITERQKEASCP